VGWAKAKFLREREEFQTKDRMAREQEEQEATELKVLRNMFCCAALRYVSCGLPLRLL
jgi:hypothetical protein